jgi:hypothetical protein
MCQVKLNRDLKIMYYNKRHVVEKDDALPQMAGSGMI